MMDTAVGQRSSTEKISIPASARQLLAYASAVRYWYFIIKCSIGAVCKLV